ncbi:hypothetical protein [Catellatospora sp. NPDC049609]|uniref:hypothetical protein n=1 Tax=Catellatospora sp. NPDC049609 TaxID=3155505 RepID=UPI003415D5D2
MATSPVPAFVFAEHARQGAFSLLAAALRRRGMRTIHVTTARPLWINRFISWLMYDRSLFVTEEQLGRIGELLGGEDVRDVQHTEYVLERLAAGAATLPGELGAQVAHRAALLDKFALGELCERRGIRVPEKIEAAGCSPARAVAAFGLPLVVKTKVGASGLGVRIASTEAAVAQALAELGPVENVFYERFIEGDYLDYSAVAGPDGPLQEIGTRTVAATSTAPPSSIETVDDPGLMEIGRQTVRELALTGFIHLDTVRDAQGRFWMMDANLRVWGSMASLRSAGIDFTEGYLAMLGLSDRPPGCETGTAGVTVTTFTGVVDAQISRKRVFGTLLAFGRYSPPYIRRFGLRYAAGSLTSSMASVAAHLLTAPIPW